MTSIKKYFTSAIIFLSLLAFNVQSAWAAPTPTGEMIKLPFTPPTISEILSFAIKAFFVIAAILALLYLLLGALAWLTSGGDKESVKKAQDKIQASIIGLVLIVAVLAIMVMLEQVVFQEKICVGLSCPITIPSLISP